MKRVTIIGGGTGTYVVTSGLKKHELDLSKIVTVFDSGGSTKRLVDEFGFLPVGDLRQSLAAFAVEDHQSWIRQLLLYRFEKGQGLAGHNLGNLILTALQDITGSTPKALEAAAKAFRLKGKVFPVATTASDLKITYSDGSVEVGEHVLDDMAHGGKRITKFSLTKPCHLYSKAEAAIVNADFIIIGPGDLYGSILPNLLVTGIRQAFAQSKAKTIFIVNLMTRFTQTHEYTALDHLSKVEDKIGKSVDYVIVNTGRINPKILDVYAHSKEFPVVNDLVTTKTTKIISGDFASSKKVSKVKGDTLVRSLMRHDSEKLTSALLKIINSI